MPREAAGNFATLRSRMRLVQDGVDGLSMADMSYVTSGYAPLSGRLLQALTLQGGVAAADTAFAVVPQYRKIANRVYIRGHVKCSVPSGGMLIAVLPEGYRVPSGTHYDIGECGGTRVSRIYADSEGNLKCEWIQNIGGSAFTGETWIQIDMDYLVD